jgi:hypothetical protein
MFPRCCCPGQLRRVRSGEFNGPAAAKQSTGPLSGYSRARHRWDEAVAPAACGLPRRLEAWEHRPGAARLPAEDAGRAAAGGRAGGGERGEGGRKYNIGRSRESDLGCDGGHAATRERRPRAWRRPQPMPTGMGKPMRSPAACRARSRVLHAPALTFSFAVSVSLLLWLLRPGTLLAARRCAVHRAGVIAVSCGQERQRGGRPKQQV